MTIDEQQLRDPKPQVYRYLLLLQLAVRSQVELKSSVAN